MERAEIHDILICAINALALFNREDLAQQLDRIRQTTWPYRPNCPHNIPEAMAHAGNIMCLACEEKCDNFVVF